MSAMFRMITAVVVLLCLMVPNARSQTITSQSATQPYPGVRLVTGRTSSPSTDFHAAFIDLCHDHVHIDASQAGSARTSSSFGQSIGAQLAVNGDFFGYGNGTSYVYGDAVGGGQRWPSIRTGRDPAYSGEWFYQRYGWIAFGDDWVDFTNTKYVKNNPQLYPASAGFEPTSVTTSVPSGTKALLSGFPQLIVEGNRYTCASPTSGSCFPDRTDMRARHPRTAMGLTADRRTFILVTVDGRTTRSVGMYGTELAKLMDDLGAWVAFNLDGGGSTQMWVRGQGTINNPSDGTPRSVLNHWGVFAGAASGKSRIPGSCDQSWDDILHQAHVTETGTTTDIDGDGLPDVCGRGPEGIECFLSSGDGFPTRVEGPTIADSSGWADPTNYSTIRMGDINGNGLADVCARANAGIRCWLSDGAGFPTRINGPALSNAEGFDDLKYLSTIRLADFNGDGMDDLCVRTADDFRCYPSTGDGFGAPVIGPALSDASGWGKPGNYATIRMADITGNGRADICARASAGIRCWLSDGNGFSASINGPAWSNANGWNNVKYWSTIRLADIDGDGRADICGRDADGIKCHLSTGNGFGPEIVGPALADASGWHDYANYSTIRLADVDGDGSLDLCARANAGIRCWLWDGAGFGRRIEGPMADATGWHRERFFRTIGFADVDGDGRADVCARASAGYFCWLSDGNGFPTRVDGPGWSDASGWSDVKHYSTIRIGDPRAAEPDPVEEDTGVGAEDVGAEDAGGDDTGSNDAGVIADIGNTDISDGAADLGVGQTDDDVDEGDGGADPNPAPPGTSATASSCACSRANDAPPLTELGFLALFGLVMVWRRGSLRGRG